MDSHDVQLLANLYWKQKAAGRHNCKISEWMSIKQGVRQGCIVPPHLFEMNTKMIMRSVEVKGGFRIGVRYTYDTVILSKTEHELQHLMDIVVQDSE